MRVYQQESMLKISGWLAKFNPFKGKKTLVSAKEKRERVRTNALKKFESVTRKRSAEEKLSAVTGLLRQFFKGYFGIRYSFTAEELTDELTRRRIDPYLKRKAQRVLERLSETTYSRDHSSEEIETLLQDAKELMQLL